MAATMCLSGAALAKAGAGVSSTITTGWSSTSEYEGWIEEAEGFLSNLTKFDLITNWTSLNTVYKLIFTEYCSRYAAVEAIKYDMSGYTSRVEAEDLINVNIFRMNEIIKLLDNSDVQDFMGV